MSDYQPLSRTYSRGGRKDRKTRNVFFSLCVLRPVGSVSAAAFFSSLAFLRGATRGVVHHLHRPAGVTVGAGRGQRQLARHLLLTEERIAEDVVVHVAALGHEGGVFDVADDLDF